jgi:UDP-glucuronate decarboxylase
MKDLTGKRLLETGDAGSIGSFLCTWLVKTGHDVLRVDNYFTGRRSNLEHPLSNARFESIRHTVPYFEDFFRRHKTRRRHKT